MKILMILVVLLSLFVVIGMAWISFKMLREAQNTAKLEHEEKLRTKMTHQSSIDK